MNGQRFCQCRGNWVSLDFYPDAKCFCWMRSAWKELAKSSWTMMRDQLDAQAEAYEDKLVELRAALGEIAEWRIHDEVSPRETFDEIQELAQTTLNNSAKAISAKEPKPPSCGKCEGWANPSFGHTKECREYHEAKVDR